MTHTIIKCKHCDKIIMQCRCPSKDKTVEYSDCGCQDMKKEKVKCKACGGDGESHDPLHDGSMACPVCNGAGIISTMTVETVN